MSYFSSRFFGSEYFQARFFSMTGGGPPPPPVSADLGLTVGGAGTGGFGIEACGGLNQPNLVGIGRGGLDSIPNTCP